MSDDTNEIQYIDPNTITVKFGLPDNPLKDEKLISLFIKANEKQIAVYKAIVDINSIKPFCNYQPKKEAMEKIKPYHLKMIRECKPTPLHVYPEGDSFTMSDDYIAYFIYLEEEFTKVPCLIFGEVDNDAVSDKKQIEWSM